MSNVSGNFITWAQKSGVNLAQTNSDPEGVLRNVLDLFFFTTFHCLKRRVQELIHTLDAAFGF